jgi:hypothetical protein
MTTTPTAVHLRLSRFLSGRDRTPNLQAHRELAQTFALVAPLAAVRWLACRRSAAMEFCRQHRAAAKSEFESEEQAMKPVLVAAAFGLAVAIVMPMIPAPSLGCQAGCNKLTSSEQIELQPGWTDCGVSLECLR